MLWKTPIFDILENPAVKSFIHNVYSISFLIASGLFIWRGIYYWRKQGYRHKNLAELLMGLFFAISLIGALYATRELGVQSMHMLTPAKKITQNKEWNNQIAKEIYIMEGEKIQYDGKTYQPTSDDQEQRQQVLEIHQNIGAITQGIYNWISLVVISIMLGLFLPVRKESLTNQRSQ